MGNKESKESLAHLHRYQSTIASLDYWCAKYKLLILEIVLRLKVFILQKFNHNKYVNVVYDISG